MRNENVSKENISTKQILQERESVKNISKENRIEFSGKLQKSVLEVQRKYGDILGFPHHVSETHPPMPTADRAAQFTPFAALNGYKEAIEVGAAAGDVDAAWQNYANQILESGSEETERLAEKKIEREYE